MQYSKALSDPPLKERYGAFLSNSSNLQCSEVMEECELPLIDISTLRMTDDEEERRPCASAIAKAATEWGFFIVINHGIRSELLKEMRKEQQRLFAKPFEEKSSKILKGTYSWGNPMAKSLTQLPWSENFLVPLKMIIEDQEWCSLEFSSLRETMEKLGSAMTDLAHVLARVLAENLGFPGDFIAEKCSMSTNYFRLNHYPPCPHSLGTFGLLPHTDSDFLTILSQDQVGGLQLRKDSSWYAVKPNQDALIVNIGDLFQAWSNDFYKSVEHKVMSNSEADRYSVAYFLCPSMDSIIGSCSEPSHYKQFTFGDFKKQVEEDKRRTGNKVGLPMFRL
ncbi:gibberellin 2-beta-dioxygenase 8-like [Zingiber officinale]|uniref:gibberellin 2-beta-dioxygenase 8-like n=1 Tax=Zingiber officinale TaxID=94328 RepID=UPI001C4BC8A5|nr:gibberellin 2-beta-dioxygenase 8-like [Zingiber officinale]